MVVIADPYRVSFSTDRDDDVVNDTCQPRAPTKYATTAVNSEHDGFADFPNLPPTHRP